MKFLAKTIPEVETLREHTDRLLEEFSRLKNIYEDNINDIIRKYIDPSDFWCILNMCCEYHDYGKANKQFQNKLLRILNKEQIENNLEEIPHNFLSPGYLPISFLEYVKERYPDDILYIIIQAIAYHHERNKEPEYTNIKRCIEEDLKKSLLELSESMNKSIKDISSWYVKYISYNERIKASNQYYELYIILKGLLHKIDHAASAHCKIEEVADRGVGEYIEDYMKKNKWIFREPQIFAKENQDENLVIVASTGIGKTETALLWINDSKAFFTLPLRVSINALYSRVKDDIGYDYVGLIHSSALEYLEDNRYENADLLYEESKLLSKKLSFSTIDQIFKYPFKYIGYEKVLATLSYSKVVIDEIQGYSPSIVAVILYAIKQLSEVGGKFLIMTATLPRIYKDKLYEFGIEFKERSFISKIRRHRVSLRNDEIVSAIDEIEEKGKMSKVLVIVNTVDKAIEVYNKLKNKSNVKVLHSLFINEDRSRLEREIKQFTEKENSDNGIWITTQIVEASLDVDFDYLYTEMSTLDSQFQRYGRCYRKRSLDKNQSNIFIYIKNISGAGSIYDKDILEKSINALYEYDDKVIEEDVKVKMVDKIYSKEMLMGTDYYKEFINACRYLENVIPYETTSKEAQKILRDITSIKVIPEDIYNENIELIENFKNSYGDKRRELSNKIGKISVSIPLYKINKFKGINSEIKIIEIEGLSNYSTINVKYSHEVGILLDELNDNIF
ncbi:CRISPR-associated helicase Cas3 [Clostridium bornimense]|uniref:CRISPR-associated helicase Cas3 n=1 Tax=Clostridium bornimense TaxID=1216932 RepID=W6SCR2_9CLOT|nr:CRISPR-associated helicase/endonuclease Cas3 [Clostridium bornimense]CDM67380.1 CRISPR-associated helicase Cas3 [Clostridium bornimense]